MVSVLVLRIDMLGQGLGYDDAAVRRALKRSGCVVEDMPGAFILIFPLGTVMYDIEPHITLNRERNILLPNGAVFQIWEHYPCRIPGCTHKRLVLSGSWERRMERKKEEVKSGKRP
jgi:hypothetical protein